jgi:hypothetical protein
MAVRGAGTILFVLLLSVLCAAECIPFSEAHKHIGETRCVSGQVLTVKEGSKGVTYLDFCEDYRLCSFTVVVFPGDLKHVGDVRELKGKTVEIHGEIKHYDDRAEIILREYQQLGGEAARIPPLPKNFDVERKGRYSAGKLSYPSSSKSSSRKRQKKGVDTFEPEPSSDPPE